MDISTLPWRPPRLKNWDARLNALNQELASYPISEEKGIELRQLASQRITAVDRWKLGKFLRRYLEIPGLQPLEMLLLSNRSIELLAQDLSVASLAHGFNISTIISEHYNPLIPILNDDSQLLNIEGKSLDGAIILFDQEVVPFTCELNNVNEELAALKSAETWLCKLITNTQRVSGGRVFVATLVPQPISWTGSADSAVPGSAYRFYSHFNSLLVDVAAKCGAIVIDLATLSAVTGQHVFWPGAYHFQSKQLYNPGALPLISERICSVISASYGRGCRVLALDLDNTLWGGVVGDDGVAGIKIGNGDAIGEAHLALQNWVLEQRRRGVILTVVSKNSDEAASEPFLKHPDMLLKKEHFALFNANWTDKASNLKAQSEALGLGLDNFVFVDDNPAERARVRQMLPSVVVPELAEDPADYIPLLTLSGAFEYVSLNNEDLVRADRYQNEKERRVFLEELGDYSDYLSSLQMQMRIDEFDEVGRNRIVQLINKSNQFNLTTKRYSADDIAEMESDPAVLNWQIRLKDIFGDHGMIAVLIVNKISKTTWAIDSLLMSCRVLTRGVEETIMNELIFAAKSAGIETITGSYVPTKKNKLVERLLDRFGFNARTTGGDSTVEYVLSVPTYETLESFIEIDKGQ